MTELTYINGKIFPLVSASCDHEIKSRNIKPFEWKRCGSKQTMSHVVGFGGADLDYCKKHAKSEGGISNA